MKFILGKKLSMSQMFDQKGNVVPLTLIEAGPCVVLQRKSSLGTAQSKKDGYDAIQVGFVKIEKKNKIKKTMKGKEYKYIKEARTEKDDATKVGDQINVTI